MNIENMTEKTMSFTKINLVSIPFSILIAGITFSLFRSNIEYPKEEIYKLSLLTSLFAFMVLTIIHELIHGFFFGIYATGGFKTVKFGINWKAMAPYCHCSEPIKVKNYRIAILMPTVFVGFIPLIIGFIVGEINIVAVSTFMIIGGIGDFIALWMLKDFKKDTLVLDHPNKMGFLYNEQ